MASSPPISANTPTVSRRIQKSVFFRSAMVAASATGPISFNALPASPR